MSPTPAHLERTQLCNLSDGLMQGRGISPHLEYLHRIPPATGRTVGDRIAGFLFLLSESVTGGSPSFLFFRYPPVLPWQQDILGKIAGGFQSVCCCLYGLSNIVLFLCYQPVETSLSPSLLSISYHISRNGNSSNLAYTNCIRSA